MHKYIHNLKKPAHIIVGMSGGVDSSVAAHLLKQDGHYVEGVFMKNWEDDDTETYCPASQDMADAQAVCDVLGIPLHRINFADLYWQRVFSYFLDEYAKGRTPNPDVLCNKEIKFKAFLDYAKQRGADFIATGHYARSKNLQGSTQLLKAHDQLKDQSYFLHALNETQLAHSLFPLGELTKEEVRVIAKKMNFKNHAKKDSTGICFIGERKFKTFLNEYLPAKPGAIKSDDGKIRGQHDGLMFYTIGQRQGLNIGGQKDKHESPWYVAEKNIAENTLIVVQGSNHPALFKQSLVASNVHWINPPTNFPLRVHAKTRYRQPDQACTIEPIAHENATHTYRVLFDAPQRAVTEGQAVVFYQGDVCLGGGIIESDTDFNQSALSCGAA